MSDKPVSRELAIYKDGTDERIRPEAKSFFVNDIVRYRISGALPDSPDYRKVNFAQSTLYDVSAHSIDFSECDFKDCLIKNAVFEDCKFDGGMFATSFFAETLFSGCTFYNVGVQNSEFHRTTFASCDLTNLLVKSSKFRRCLFEQCGTSNKVMEMSVLDDTTFRSTNIQIDTITENFGLTVENLENSTIRSGRVREHFQTLTLRDLEELQRREDLSPLEKLRLHYFLKASLLAGSELLDQSLDLAGWIKIYQNPGTFVELLDRFSEFLVQSYDKERITLQPLLLLHYVTSRLTTGDRFRSELVRVAQSIGGAHLILSRIVEEYLDVLDRLIEQKKGKVVFLAEGSGEAGYYHSELAPWLENTGSHITRVTPHNSPFEVEVIGSAMTSLMPILALFLATRTRLEILQLKEGSGHAEDADAAVESEASTPEPEADQAGKSLAHESSLVPISEKREKAVPKSLFLFDLGLAHDEKRSYQLQLRSFLPGSLLFDLRLNVSTCMIGRIRDVLLQILTPHPPKSDNSSTKRNR